MSVKLIGKLGTYLKVNLTEDQQIAAAYLEGLLSETKEEKCLLLKGYAGTGKTTLLGAFVKALPAFQYKSVLLAPTGRAAKVFAQSSGKGAMTIHRKIYQHQLTSDGSLNFSLGKNKHTNTIFIVDEASMISDYSYTKETGIGNRNVLEDIMEYVFSGKNCSLIFMGDEAQLPPVGSDFSPALQLEYMQHHFPFITFKEVCLREVVRQEKNSNILFNATQLRNLTPAQTPRLEVNKTDDFVHLLGTELQESIESAYSKFGKDETIVVCRSNKRANQFNQQIRSRILYMEENICRNDYLMVVKNNYTSLKEDSEAGFLANGEIIQIKRIVSQESKHGFQFARVMAQLVDYPAMGEVELLLLLDAIHADGPALGREQLKLLFFAVEKEYNHIHNKKKRYESVLNDPYFTAVQVKYAYAVTCHKAQGGQWANVFIDHGFLPEGGGNADFHRWLYTAVTRATEKVYLVNFNREFLVNQE